MAEFYIRVSGGETLNKEKWRKVTFVSKVSPRLSHFLVAKAMCSLPRILEPLTLGD